MEMLEESLRRRKRTISTYGKFMACAFDNDSRVGIRQTAACSRRLIVPRSRVRPASSASTGHKDPSITWI